MKNIKLSIIVPVFNEENTINVVLTKLIDIELKNANKEIIVVNDGSTDSSKQKISKFSKVELISYKKNQGKGYAIRTGLRKCTGDYVIIQDADLEYNPKFINKLLKKAIDENCDAVYGSRFLKKIPKVTIISHLIGNVMLSFVTSILYGKKITDVETGYKLFKLKTIKKIKLNANGFDFEPEVTAKLLKMNIKLIEIPIDFFARSFSEGKKITWIDGVKALFVLIKIRLGFG